MQTVIGMMKNPRNEENLQNIILECELKNKNEILNTLFECESIGSTKIVFIEKNKQTGLAFIVSYFRGKANILETRRIRAAKEEEPWEKITQLLEGCEEPRIIKGHGIVMMECLTPKLKLNEARTELCSYKDVLVDCYYEW